MEESINAVVGNLKAARQSKIPIKVMLMDMFYDQRYRGAKRCSDFAD